MKRWICVFPVFVLLLCMTAVCAAAAECGHETAGIVTVSNGDGVTHRQSICCDDCGEELHLLQEKTRCSGENGICSSCGQTYACPHSETNDEKIYKPKKSGGHTATTICICRECGQIARTINEEENCSDYNKDALCDRCGGHMLRGHSGKLVQGYLSNRNKTHQVVKLCDCCETVIYKIADEPCTLSDGSCVLCEKQQDNDDGRCGKNAYWKWTEGPTLTIYGRGQMYDYAQWDSRAPWMAGFFEEVVVEEGITSIGTNAFLQELPMLERVWLPAGLERIGENAFFGYDGILSDIYYAGTDAQWNKMQIADGNEALQGARLHTACEGAALEEEYRVLGGNTHYVDLRCTACGGINSRDNVQPCLDSDGNGFCDLCGARLKLLAIVGANMTLGHELIVNFLVPASEMTLSDHCIAKIYLGEKQVAQRELKQYNKTYYAASYGVTAKQMCDSITVVIYDAQGNRISEPCTKTVQDYAMVIVNSGDTSDEVKAVAVDMLNYGTEAQKYFAYNEASYANAKLTDEQQTRYATKQTACENIRIRGDRYIGAFLSLEQGIRLNFVFENGQDGMEAHIRYVDSYGEEKILYKKTRAYEENTCVVTVDDLVWADAGCLVSVKVYDENGQLYGWCSDSVESYVARHQNDEDVGAVVSSIAKLAVSARQNWIGDQQTPPYSRYVNNAFLYCPTEPDALRKEGYLYDGACYHAIVQGEQAVVMIEADTVGYVQTELGLLGTTSEGIQIWQHTGGEIEYPQAEKHSIKDPYYFIADIWHWDNEVLKRYSSCDDLPCKNNCTYMEDDPLLNLGGSEHGYDLTGWMEDVDKDGRAEYVYITAYNCYDYYDPYG